LTSRHALFALLFAFLVLITGTATSVRADGELSIGIREVKVDNSALVQFLAKVVDENGLPQRLSSNSFTVRVGEQQIPITSVQTVTDAQVGISAMLLIDTSGSMVGTPLADARDAAGQYVESLQPNDEVSVASFANGTQVIADFSSDFATVESQLPNLRAFGDTALYSAVGEAAQRMSERPAARRVIIMLSDGAEFGISSINRQDALAAATTYGTPFYVIGLGPTIDSAFLQELADASGGAFFAAPSSDQLTGIFDQIAELLRSEYVVSVDFAGTGLGGRTNAAVRAELGDRNGEVALNLDLPPIPVAPQERPTQAAPVIPQPIQITPEPEPAGGGGSAVGIMLAIAVLALVCLGAWLFIRRARKRRLERFVFDGAPAYTPRETDTEPVARNAPTAFLRLDSGEEFELQDAATIGIDPECTFQLPLSRSEFGNAELRVWFANQRYLIRDTAPRTRMRLNGRPVAWGFLSEGDEVEIRGVKMQFRMASVPPANEA
jgi:uncharacterized protein YegL